MKKSVVLFFAAFLSIAAISQNVQEGVNHLYAERYQSAKTALERLTASNPNNLEAVYWLGQTNIETNNVAAAKSLYEKTLATNGNAPLILAGMGHIDLLQGKTSEARQRFESAITASRGKKGDDPAIINAIARANIDAKQGDVAYALGKLNAAISANPNVAELYLNLGNAQRKTHNGGAAVQSWRKAAQLNPALTAMTSYNMARLYRTQENWDIVLENLNSAITADPKFAPAYERSYEYYLTRKQDFNKAQEFLDKYLANTDQTVENDYFKAQTCYLQKNFDCSIQTLSNIVKQAGGQTNPRVYRLLAVTYLEKGDTTTACQYVNEFFAKAKEENIVGYDYLLHTYSCAKNDPVKIRENVMKAVAMDSVLSRQVKLLDEAIENARKNQQKILEGQLKLISYELRGEKYSSKTEIFQIGLPFYLGGNYPMADSLFTAYATHFPDSIYGHYWSGLSKMRIDTSMTVGAFVPNFERTLQIADLDKVRYKSQAVQSAQTLAIYYYNSKSDKPNAIKWAQKGLEFDPGNANLKAILDQLQKPTKTTPPKTTPPKTTPKPSTNKTKTTSTTKPPVKPKVKKA